jgi:hypothetical protein
MKYLLLISILLLGLVSCSNTVEDLPTIDDSQLVTYGVAGYIISIDDSDNEHLKGTIFVEGELGKNGADYHRAYVSVDESTIVYGKEELSYEDLEVGMYVNVFFSGPAMESDPVQADAKQINIVPEEVLNTPDTPEEE